MEGRVALITGGSKGLGYAMGLKFAESGAKIALAARTEAEVKQAALSITQTTGQKAIGYVCDVANADDIKQLHQAVTTDFERIDILVNNAGFDYQSWLLQQGYSAVGSVRSLKQGCVSSSAVDARLGRLRSSIQASINAADSMGLRLR